MAESRYQAKGWTKMRVYGFGWRLGGTRRTEPEQGNGARRLWAGALARAGRSSHTWRCASAEGERLSGPVREAGASRTTNTGTLVQYIVILHEHRSDQRFSQGPKQGRLDSEPLLEAGKLMEEMDA
ncbi:uncharacterized protein TrAFT101_008910 [Trichoderma asperellum]|uniref:uncharacterized protein n=1 Tax=Trichoderma asperellum TaxID=101201 RepID=UPI0033319947|nr:hypothetical protein TrAFT101_008910 [Trichoderma asperellum]